ncbi:hypothetical protein Pyn_17649 [Prunus yedoensis var. nudiflora]|uniref:Uncharacterized protein n=1 Tax=Prunus yedoensis var. nudiflora TaxID=2094558 RepID=A0A314Y925_PRUYE|nr:hypothetical protein Pyn_17649 [Prunus yedoensis var. nudiflora]
MESLAELKEGRGLIIQRMISQGMSWKKTFDNSLAGRSNCLRGEDQKASPSNGVSGVISAGLAMLSSAHKKFEFVFMT